LLLRTLGELGRVALEVLGVGAEDSLWGSHGGAEVIPGAGSLSRNIFISAMGRVGLAKHALVLAGRLAVVGYRHGT
jgi:hypothetical protein